MAILESSVHLIKMIFVFLCFTLISNYGVEAFNNDVSETGLDGVGVNRTGYHFQSPKNWINDPNGPMYYNGIYHLFYQYNPKAAAWASDIVWGHSVSKDMVNWFCLDVAMAPMDSFDVNGCWSGSATILPGNKPVMLYTGIDINNVQVQNIAVPKNSSDPLLVEWKKLHKNPLILPPNGINATSFRDPTTAWLGKDGYWRILVGSERSNLGTALLFRSKDFMEWTASENNFHSAPDTGIWECPDFFPVSLKGKKGLDTSESGADVKYILKVSVQRTWSDFYTVGAYCLNKDAYVPDNTPGNHYSTTTGLKFDYGKFYASKTFFDEAKNRRILWAWVNESDSAADDFAKGWAGIQAIPRTLWLDRNGKQLLQWPIEELKTLRTNEVKLKKTPLTKGSVFEVQGITAAQADIEVRFRLPSLENAESFDPSWNDAQQLCGRKDATVQGGIGPFGLLTLASKDLDEYTAVFFRVFKAQDKPVVLMCSGGIRSSLKVELDKPSYGAFVDVDLIDGEISLRSLIDHTVVESFGAGGKTCITTRVYPTLAVGMEAHLYAFNNGTETVEIKRLNAWTMQTPNMNLGHEISLAFPA
ncbi:beta-fructofuranosidase, insoluble isoenzyme 1-like [Papaver somniferum]|uniref:beta-fructofuranosidase, insoluble isoenzyme 1-like n=1 Tax=Papaver somniferum TaxID=3469 RepID=UPI000E6FD0C9|nr:beta-fructofuranosidase, insoluble isoenzyme 1-like [Papaver somniferum]